MILEVLLGWLPARMVCRAGNLGVGGISPRILSYYISKDISNKNNKKIQS